MAWLHKGTLGTVGLYGGIDFWKTNKDIKFKLITIKKLFK